MNQLTFQTLPEFESEDQIEELIESNDWSRLMVVPLIVGEYCPDWEYAQTVCLRLAAHEDQAVRANACLGFAYIARTKRHLDKKKVRPILIRECKRPNPFRWRIVDSILDTMKFMGWKYAKKFTH